MNNELDEEERRRVYPPVQTASDALGYGTTNGEKQRRGRKMPLQRPMPLPIYRENVGDKYLFG